MVTTYIKTLRNVLISRSMICLWVLMYIPCAQALLITDKPIVALYGIWPYPTGSNVKGDYVEVIFEGTGIRWKGVKWPNAGLSLITIDGDSIDTINQYESWPDVPFSWEKNDLPFGLHTLRITVLGEKSRGATDTYVNFNLGFETLGAPILKTGKGWKTEGEITSTNTQDNSVEVAFVGEGIRWRGTKFRDAGKAQVFIDNVEVEVIDQYAAVDGTPFVWEKNALKYGDHTLKMKVTGGKNTQSSGSWINYSDFEITGTSIKDTGECWETLENGVRRTNSAEDKVEVTFYGSSIRWTGIKCDDGGVATIVLDGEIIDEVDLYEDDTNLTPFIWQRENLSEGVHTLTISPSLDKNPGSGDYFINYMDFRTISVTAPNAIVYNTIASGFYLVGNCLFTSDDQPDKNIRIMLYTMDGKLLFNQDMRTTTEGYITLPLMKEYFIIRAIDPHNQSVFTSKSRWTEK